ncbi:MAG TPA: hypothetical protein VKY74_23725 [Chloroflexia bacterium]|nr:hypothetical protein [Chloroflexia bacterium]
MKAYWLWIGLVVLGALAGGPAAQPPAAPRCFPGVPGIDNCVDGRFREYWEVNGGLPVFGYPISPPQNRQTEGGVFVTQFFERNRLELHPENRPPYDVLLGRLGDDRLKQLGRDWHSSPREPGPLPGCLWFAETGHNVCDQEIGAGFQTYWRTHGLRDPQLDAYQQSLALFGLPLTAPQMESSSPGPPILTQWFERARFEYHPEKPRAFHVLLGLLGDEITGQHPLPPLPTPSPRPPPRPVRTAYPPPVPTGAAAALPLPP